jgi:predicted site-specific integrase-resolvase
MGAHIMEKLMSLKQVCDFAGINIYTMKRWLKKGQGPKVLWTPNGRRRFREEDVVVWYGDFFSEEKHISKSNTPRTAKALGR